ncbi:MAG: LTA synthase family protein [Bacilli bacterium]|nr:LTA synthase family protein [Bacilli bacterium]
MKDKLYKIGNRTKDWLKKFVKGLRNYVKHNALFITFVLTTLLEACFLRFFTVKNYTAISPILADFAVILLVGSFAYFFKPKNRFKYLMVWSIIFTATCLINSAYYSNYVSFTSFSLLATSVQIFGVGDALNTIIEVKDFSYILGPIILIIVNLKLKNTSYYDYANTKKKSRIIFLKTLLVSAISLGFFMSTVTGTDISRLYKQWNREYVVMKFGIYIYQSNDLVASLKPQISPLFGYDKAAKEFREYYDEYSNEKKENKYTNKYKGKNVIVIHAESIQNFLLDTKINGKDLTPNLKRLASEGLYFSNFYAQESVGTSSDSEFTFNTSLLPASNGTVFVSYWDREYVSTPILLKEKGYYTFSMHANKGNFWNREVVHKQLGYDKFYNYTTDYEINDEDIIGLGLNDKSFFKQSTEKISKINEKHDNWYGVLLMLTNHTPFTGLEDITDLDLTYKYTKTNEETGEKEEVVNDYLKDTTLGNYFTTAHYADEALGEFVNELDEAGLLDNTVLVIYGDHDAKIKRSEYNRYYNYNPETDSKYNSDDPNYKEYTKYDYELNRKVPFIIWTKDNQEKKEITDVMGMYDILPTLGNMLGISSPYALGHDMFSNDDHFVVFPNGNWVTNKMYYDSQNDEGVLLDQNAVISSDYIDNYTKRAEAEVNVSNNIIVHDLIKKTKESKKVLKENKNG